MQSVLGTCDPIHHGYLVAAGEVAIRIGLEEVVFVRIGHRWQKAGRKVSAIVGRDATTFFGTSPPRRRVGVLAIAGLAGALVLGTATGVVVHQVREVPASPRRPAVRPRSRNRRARRGFG